MSATDETSLLAKALKGDPRAFAEIVERYYPLVCAVAYGVTGDLAQSEDICQETFLIAWRKLDDVNDARRLRSWLCGIARNLSRNARRHRIRHSAEPLSADACSKASVDSCDPQQSAIAREEQAILWACLERVPPVYRETLILYYWQHQSVAEVADLLAVSEEVVRKRLSRGRKKLKDHWLERAESVLSRTVPSKTIVAAICAVLPAREAAAAGTGVAAGQLAIVGKTATTISFSGILAVAGSALGVLLGLLGGWLGTRATLQKTRTPEERVFVLRMSIGFTVAVLAFLTAMGVAGAYLPSPWPMTIMISLLIPTIILVCNNRRLLEIESRGTMQSDECPKQLISPELASHRRSRLVKHWVAGAAGGIFGSASWIAGIVSQTGDWLAFSLVAATAVLLFLGVARQILRMPDRESPLAMPSILGSALAVLGLVGMLVLLLRTSRWQTLPMSELHTAWACNVAMLTIGAVLYCGTRWQRHTLTSPSSPPCCTDRHD